MIRYVLQPDYQMDADEAAMLLEMWDRAVRDPKRQTVVLSPGITVVPLAPSGHRAMSKARLSAARSKVR